ncbi:MAG: ABC-F family ATP-binding cassette domain-containing protein [Clostridia bacterium]|nr:ABC-F family ATP-binding cassette domain-containing protein [Clostridia bacterium]MBQ8370557.1 ABC-F family ATP-binding cassette domain-containing protein [Clostridia bacterium]
MLQLKNITITHTGDERCLLKDFSFTPYEGEKIAVVGEEGNGKSTLLKLMHDPALLDGYASYTGTVTKGTGAKCSVTGYMSQLPDGDGMAVWEYLGKADGWCDFSPKELSRLCRELSVPEELLYSEQKMESLSGGESVKVRLLALLALSPDILLLDEPSNDLDLEALVWLEEFIRTVPQTVIYISHDEVLLENTAQCVIHIEQIMRKTEPKVTVSRTGYREYMETRGLLIEKSAQMAKNDRDRFEKKMEKYRRIFERVQFEQNAISRQNPGGGRLLKKKMHSVKAMGRRFEKEEENLTKKIDAEEAVMIGFQEVHVPRGKVILELSLDELRAGDNPHGRLLAENIRLTVMGGESVVITGPNGCGKSTLIKKIAAELLGRRDIRAAYMPQDYDEHMPGEMTAVGYLTRDGSRTEETKIRTYLGSIKFTAAEMDHRIRDLSGGQRAKLYFIGMILDGADTLILDEPTRNLSPMTGPVIRRILSEFGGTIIAVSHDRKYIEETADAEIPMQRIWGAEEI